MSSCGACSGGQDVGYVGNGDGTSNGTLTINGISVAADGTYSVAIAYVNGDSAPRSAQLSFDGAAPVSVSFPSTGGWGNVSTLTVTGAFRQGSANTLKFANPTGWAPDIDGIGAPAKQ
ncbi:Secreted alpha-galactosidase [Burkholderia cepacia]|uniref:Secreted alpha-galactosidase n=1 Tax=Burkholderia cepacia TaxID=292 RepID=A0AAE8NFL1_BURCE|nr:Secreted alpha-galactosidase [Burkholderia cepacia]